MRLFVKYSRFEYLFIYIVDMVLNGLIGSVGYGEIFLERVGEDF